MCVCVFGPLDSQAFSVRDTQSPLSVTFQKSHLCRPGPGALWLSPAQHRCLPAPQPLPKAKVSLGFRKAESDFALGELAKAAAHRQRVDLSPSWVAQRWERGPTLQKAAGSVLARVLMGGNRSCFSPCTFLSNNH